jgi:hypothetical protein
MIDVQVGQQHYVRFRQRDPSLAKARKGSRPGIDEYSSGAVDEYQIARCRASRRAGASRAEYQHLEGRRRCLSEQWIA